MVVWMRDPTPDEGYSNIRVTSTTLVLTMSSTLSPLNTHPPPSYDTLRLWLESHGGSVQKSLEAVYNEADGWNVKAKEDIERGAICA